MHRCFFLWSLIVLWVLLVPVHGLCAELDRIDSDGDGWSDAFEKKLGTNPGNKESQPSSIEDPDMDGLTNVEERVVNSDPIDPDSDDDGLSDGQEALNRNTDPLNADTDRDGASDFSEILDGTNPRVPDSDGDDWLDGAEKKAGSDPLNPTSTPKSQ